MEQIKITNSNEFLMECQINNNEIQWKQICKLNPTQSNWFSEAFNGK